MRSTLRRAAASSHRAAATSDSGSPGDGVSADAALPGVSAFAASSAFTAAAALFRASLAAPWTCAHIVLIRFPSHIRRTEPT